MTYKMHHWFCSSNASLTNLKFGNTPGGLLVFLQGRNGKYYLLAAKKAKESCQKYLNQRNISIICFVKQFHRD